MLTQIKELYETLPKQLKNTIQDKANNVNVDINVMVLHEVSKRDWTQLSAMSAILKEMTHDGKPAYTLTDVYILEILSGYGNVTELYNEFVNHIKLSEEKPELVYVLNLIKGEK